MTPPNIIDPKSIRLVVLTGMSGGGKTVALRALEDLEFYCVDNLPAALIPQLVAAVSQGEHGPQTHIAVGVDVRNREADLSRMPSVLSDIAATGVEVHLIFLDSRDDVLIKRYSETRRRHPLSSEGLSLADAIARERKLLRPLSAIAERVLDSSDLNVHQLRRLIATGYAAASDGMTLMFESFAYRRGLPLDADFVFDARCLPNPHWEARLRPLSGKDAPVREYLEQQPLVAQYFHDTVHWLENWLPQFEKDDRSYLTICIGCTGGRHRSVYLVEKLAEHFRSGRGSALTFHRELE
ncbi:RNase adapter RapZ [Pinirhizobacter soli]|uniref:RNase adapter RapZ n=2 Tax=Pinirhizobacter TaxID=2950430 RepID=UPI002029EDC0|nr:RNase adapter RapZ [Pinirhizobacter soli]